MLHTAPLPTLLAINKFLNEASIGRTLFYQLVRSGEIRVVKIGGRTLVPRSELERLEREARAACHDGDEAASA